MDPQTKQLAVVVCLGMLALFPVFNQVAYAVIDTLQDPGGDARMSDFFKNWDHIPEDRKLEYWDGRNVPPGQWDGSRLGDDASIRGGSGASGGAGGAGGTETQLGVDDEPVARERYVEEVLWTFRGDGTSDTRTEPIGRGRDYHWVNISFDYSGFTGEAAFRLLVAGEAAWLLEPGSAGLLAVYAQDVGNKSVAEVGRATLEVEYDYNPTFAPARFDLAVTGTYLETY